MVSGALGVTRTPDTRFRKPLLYPLSYEGLFRFLLRFFLRNSISESLLDHIVGHNALVLLQDVPVDVEGCACLRISQHLHCRFDVHPIRQRRNRHGVSQVVEPYCTRQFGVRQQFKELSHEVTRADRRAGA